jgi:hypothetical protein
MRDWTERLMDQLDQDQSSWYIDWASQQSLQQFARSVVEESDPVSRHAAIRALKRTTINQMAHRILNCAISQRIVSVPEETAK